MNRNSERPTNGPHLPNSQAGGDVHPETPSADAFAKTFVSSQIGDTSPQFPTEQAVFGQYQLNALIGQGGMGRVYRATHLKLKKTVVVKILSPLLQQDAELVARFDREMEAIGKLDHAHIVRALDAGEIDGVRYLAMEYVEGTDVSRRIQEKGPLSVIQALAALRQAALGLGHAHAHGLVHRDIKPSNLLWSKAGQIKVLDLGLALLRDQSAEAGLTRTGQILGTPEYMAPEQWDNTSTVDQRADLYGLGGVLVFLLTGKSPFGGATRRSLVHWMRAHLEEPPSELSAQRTDIPSQVEAIAKKLLAKRPEDRFASCSELVKNLDVAIASLKKTEGQSGAKGQTPGNSSTARSTNNPQPTASVDADSTLEAAEADSPNRTSLPFAWIVSGSLLAGLLVIGVVATLSGGSATPNPPPQLAPVAAAPGPAPTLQSSGAVSTPTTSAIELSNELTNERPVADWVISSGGAVVLIDNSSIWLTQSGQLPADKVHVRAIDLSRCPAIQDADMSKLASCRELESLQLNGTSISDAGLVELESLRLLKRLELQDCPVTDNGLSSIAKLSDLETLRLNGIGITDRGLDAIRGLRRLQVLSISGSGITNFGFATLAESHPELTQLLTEQVAINDAGLVPLAKLRKLRTLNLSLTPITDRGCESLSGLTSLSHLIVQGTQLSPTGIRELRTKMPLCRVYGGRFDPRRQTVARILSEGGQITYLTEGNSAQPLTDFDQLPDEFSVQSISLQGVTTLTRNSLRQLLLDEVSEVSLRDSSLDPGDLRLLGSTSPFLTTLDLSGTVTSDRDLGAILQLKNLQKLDISRTAMTLDALKILRMRLPPSCIIISQ